MALAAAAVAVSDNPVLDTEAYRHAGVFISYASEDHDIAQAVYQSLQALGETIFDRIKIFLDSKSMEGGDGIRTDIKEGLKKADFLVVLYTGLFKRSHGYTGWEVGFFEGLIEDEVARYGQTTRKILYLYCEEPPSIGGDILGISIKVDAQDLSGICDDYVRKSIQTTEEPDLLARLFLDIADRAESRLPPPLRNDRANLDQKRDKRRKLIAQSIVPNLKGKLFESMSTRVTRNSVEQKLISFELPKPASDQTYVSIPDDAKLTPHAGAFDIFGMSQQNEALTWREFRNVVKSRDALGGSSILLAIEQAVISAISPAIPINNDQILKSSSDQIFRVLVTRQLDYYNGCKVIQVYFIQKLQCNPLGNNTTSTILGFVNVAAKYRFIFIEQESSLSVESFMFEPEPLKIQNKVRQLIRELLLIEEESRNLKLDQIAAISTYFGGDQAHLATAKSLQDRWFEARGKLMASAEKVLSTNPAAVEFSAVNKEWLATLSSFRLTSDEINSTVTLQALENLKKSFTGSKPATNA
jgi:TIR domain